MTITVSAARVLTCDNYILGNVDDSGVQKVTVVIPKVYNGVTFTGLTARLRFKLANKKVDYVSLGTPTTVGSTTLTYADIALPANIFSYIGKVEIAITVENSDGSIYWSSLVNKQFTNRETIATGGEIATQNPNALKELENDIAAETAARASADEALQSDVDTLSGISTTLQANVSSLQGQMGSKVDKVSGKGLSTNDFTDAEKALLAQQSGTNTGDQDLSGLVPKSDIVNDLVTGGTTKPASAETVKTLKGLVDNVFSPIVSNPQLDEIIRYNGSNWVNGSPATASASAGIEFFSDTTDIIAKSAENSFAVETLSKTPITTAENVEPISCVNNTAVGSAYLYNTALGRNKIDAGTWQFDFFVSVSSVANGRVSNLTKNLYAVTPYATTVNITGNGAERTVTASGETPFAISKISANTNNTVGSYLQTPKGAFLIVSRSSDTVITIATPTGYANESSVNFSVWKKLFGATSPTITSTGTNYALNTTVSVQSEFTINATDKLGMIVFGTSNNTTTVNYVYNGTAHYSHFSTPLITLHNNLAGVQGGSATEQYHLTQAEHTRATSIVTLSGAVDVDTVTTLGRYIVDAGIATNLPTDTSFSSASYVLIDVLFNNGVEIYQELTALNFGFVPSAKAKRVGTLTNGVADFTNVTVDLYYDGSIGLNNLPSFLQEAYLAKNQANGILGLLADLNNAYIEFLVSGGVELSRNKADSYPAAKSNLKNASSTGHIHDFIFNDILKAFMLKEGYLAQQGCYGGIGITTEQVLANYPNGAATKLTAWNANSASYSNLTPDHSNDQITVLRTGKYKVSFGVGTRLVGGNYTLTATLVINGTPTTNTLLSAVWKNDIASITNGSFSSYVSLSANDILTINFGHSYTSPLSIGFQQGGYFNVEYIGE